MKQSGFLFELTKPENKPLQSHIFVDIIIETRPGVILLIERGVAPFGWGLPGGYVDSCECPREAAIRESREETGLTISIRERFSKYQFVDSLGNNVGTTTVFIAFGYGAILAADDAKQAIEFDLNKLPRLISEHSEIISDYIKFIASGIKPEANKRLVSTKSIPSLERRAA